MALRICVHCAVSIQTRPFFTGNAVADESWINLGARGARGFHFVPLAFRDEFRKARGDRGGRVGLAITLDRCAEQLGHSM